MKEYKYTINGNKYDVQIVDIVENIATVAVNGENYSVEMEKEPEPEKKKVVVKPVAQPQPAADAWKCKCGTMATGKFCPECGSQKPADGNGWTCSCGALNKGKFCQSCGAKKPEGAPLYRCDKCGWEPEDPANPPKFCPECGDIFDDNDKK